MSGREGSGRPRRGPAPDAAPPLETAASGARDPLVLALDLGTSSIRAGIFDAGGASLSGLLVRRSHAVAVSPDGGATVEVADVVAVVSDALDELASRAGDTLGRLAAVGVAGFMHSLAALDAQGRPLGPALTWADATSARHARELRAELDPGETWMRTGAPLHAGYWPARVRMLRERHRDRVAAWAGVPELLVESLTGVRAVDPSLASATGLVERRSRDWDGELLRRLDVDPGTLPPIAPEVRPVADGLSPGAARRWPRLAGVPWLAPAADGACHNVGTGATTPDRAALMIGTSSAMRVVVPGTPPSFPAGLFCFGLAGGASLLGAQLSEGGGTAAWLARVTSRTLASLDSEARDRPRSDRLHVLPYLAGERGPGYHDRASGAITGIRRTTGPATIHRALLEAVALRLALADRRIGQALGTPPAVVASGGAIARSRLWPRILADALGREVLVSHVREATLRGAALRALEALGATDALVRPPESPVAPDAAAHRLYAAALERQESLYEALVAGRSASAASATPPTRGTPS